MQIGWNGESTSALVFRFGEFAAIAIVVNLTTQAFVYRS
jgi:hypothetical protein